MAEVLRRKILSTFIDTQSEEEKDQLIALSSSLFYVFLQNTTTASLHIKWFLKNLKANSGEMQSISNFSFWMSLLNIADLF